MYFFESFRRCVPSDFCREVDESCVLLGYYSGNFLLMFRVHMFWISSLFRTPEGISESSWTESVMKYTLICYRLLFAPSKPPSQLMERVSTTVSSNTGTNFLELHVGHETILPEFQEHLENYAVLETRINQKGQSSK